MPFFRPLDTLGRHCLAGLLLLACAAPAPGGPRYDESFDGPEVSLEPAGCDGSYRILAHRRTRDFARRGGSEQIDVAAEGGSYLYLAQAVPAARVIRELRGQLWVRANRPGARLLARVVLPRSTDPATGEAVRAVVAGTSYTRPGSWQLLELTDLPERLTDQVRVLRSQIGPQVDPREAYVEALLLNVFNPGATRLWFDDLELTGVVTPVAADGAPVVAAAHQQRAAEAARLQGTVMVVGDRPLLPRIVDHRGEPLELLARLGFNGVRLRRPPTAPLLAEAERLGLWLIAPPDAAATGASRVLAWDLGRGLSGADLDATARAARAIRQADPLRRPLLADVSAELRAFSRLADILVFGRQPLGTSLELADYAGWQARRPQLARPGTPVWMRIQTSLDLQAIGQSAALGGAPSSDVGYRQIGLLVQHALAAGARGLCFDSPAPLADDTQRARMLELINLELALIAPWAAEGHLFTGVTSSDPQVVATAMQSERARLLLPTRTQVGDQFIPDSRVGPLALVVPGMPASSDSYLLTPAGLRPLRQRRVAGGIRITLDAFDERAVVLVTGDPRIVEGMTRRLRQSGGRAAQLLRAVAAERLTRLAAAPSGVRQAVGARQAIHELLSRTEEHLAAGDARLAWDASHRALAAADRVSRTRWEGAVAGLPQTVSHPRAMSLDALPAEGAALAALELPAVGENRLPAGDCEDLTTMQAAGWRHVRYGVPGVASGVELVGGRAGGRAVRLWAAPADAVPPSLVEAPPVWLTTPPLAVPTGQAVRIRARVRVPDDITGSVDGLLVFDSLGGTALAARFGRTGGWRELNLLRVAVDGRPLQVTFALTGLGEASIDDVRVELVAPSVAPVALPAPTATVGQPTASR